MSYLYECECDTCKPDFLKLSVSQSIIEQLKKVVLNAYKTLVSKQSYQSNDLSNTQAYKDVINETNSIFQNALKEGVKDNVIPAILQQALKSDIFVFSALKTHAQLFEASRLLKDDTGKIKPFNQFLNDIQSTFKNYNELYLESEYQFAVGSSLMNVKWSEFENNTDRYNLQYRTAGDEKVRASHAELDMITLPQNDPFWNLYFPPNGWRCRCSVSEVLKSKYPQDNSADAIAKGEKATTQIGKDGKNRLEIFRFNPGKQKVIFPPNHPYRKLQGAEGVIKTFDKGYKQSVYAKTLNEQYSTIFKSKNGGYVQVHELVNFNAEDYNDVIDVAKAFAKQGKVVHVLPEVHVSEKEARKKIFNGLANKSSNPDLMVDNILMDVKRPHNFQTVTHNANKASNQNSIAVISDRNLKFNNKTMNERVLSIFRKDNISKYQFDTVYFYSDDKIIKYKRQ